MRDKLYELGFICQLHIIKLLSFLTKGFFHVDSNKFPGVPGEAVAVAAIDFLFFIFYQVCNFLPTVPSHIEILLTAEFFALPKATMPAGPAHWLPFHRGGGGVWWGRGECRAEWQVVGEQWESHWLTGWKLNTGPRSCLTAEVSLLPWGRGPVYWPSW